MKFRRFAAFALIIVSSLAALWCAGCTSMFSKQGATRTIDVPKVPPANSMAVFYFRPKGDADAKFYAAGFGRALSDRLYCAPTCLTLQPDPIAVEEQFHAQKRSSRDAITDDIAKSIGKSLGVRYAISGDLQLHGGKVDISAYVFDVMTKSKSPAPIVIKRSGKLADLPQMQTSIAAEVVKALDLDSRRSLADGYGKPNFTKPSTLLLYGRSFFSDNWKQVLDSRWQAINGDPDSSFAVMRMLGTFVYMNAPYRAIRADPRFVKLIEDAAVRFRDDSQINFLVGWLYINQYQYKKAESHLRALVSRDPKFARGHDALAMVAMYRSDSALAMAEARKQVKLWPTSSRAHLVLAEAYSAAANDARRGHHFGDMTFLVRRSWQRNSERAYEEACIAIGLNSKSSRAWGIIMDCSLELGYRDYDRRAFEEMVKINPKDYSAYNLYMRSLWNQWGGTQEQRDELYARVDRVFGKDSTQACLIRGWEMLAEAEHDALRPEILRLADKALEKSKGNSLSALELKCTVFIGLHRRAEMLELAKKGFKINPSPSWRMLVARGYGFRAEEYHDSSALMEAYKLLTVYVDEIPNDPFGHDQLGWCLSHMGRRDSAKKEFERALELDPSDQFAKEKMEYVR